ncbi:MAG: GrpB family protein [Bacteroidota bacterium]
MRVLVVPYDPHWPTLFEAEAAAIQTALEGAVVALHHIGSTAIPGLHAKPVIDVLVEATEVAQIDALTPAMETSGYEAMGEYGIAGRRYFRKDDREGRRTHQVHAFVAGHAEVERHLAFRDFLRAHPAWAAAYSALKQGLAAAHPHDMDAYIAGKDAFIKETDQLARAWRQAQPRVERRIVILGNAGSGKTTMARALQDAYGLPHLDLDTIAWAEPGKRRPLADSVAALEAFARTHASWVVEGSYASLAQAALPHCTELRFLNPGVEACLAHCRARPWEPEKYANQAEQDERLPFLLAWVRGYEARDDEYGLAQHQAVYDGFKGLKRVYGAGALHRP